MMAIDAQIAVLPAGTRELELRDVTMPAPRGHEVLVEQLSFGVCHSQLDRIFDPTREHDMLLGHESLARVVSVGDRVDYVEPGDEVFTTWIPRTPEAGRAPVPSRLTFPGDRTATTHNTYTWGTHSLVDEQWLVKVPDGGVDPDLGSVIGCALMTGAGAVMNTAGLQAGETVAVWGAGGVGLCAVSAASILGARTIIAVDVNDAKLDLARLFGATHGVNARTSDPVDAIRKLTPHPDGTTGVDYGIDCTGIGDNVAVSLAAVRPGISGAGVKGGSDILVGIPRKPFQLDSFDLLRGEKSLRGSVGGSAAPVRDFDTFVEWARSGRFRADQLVTNRYQLHEINEAVDALHHGRVDGRAVVNLAAAAEGTS